MKNPYSKLVGSHFCGIYLNVSLQRLINVLGNENVEASEDGKIMHCWMIDNEFEDSIITFYDYKEGPTSEDAPYQWHVGCRGAKTEEVIDFLVDEIGFNEDEVIKVR